MVFGWMFDGSDGFYDLNVSMIYLDLPVQRRSIGIVHPPETCLSSVLWLEPFKIRSFLIKNNGHLGSRYIPGSSFCV